jgi:hypothetical protein
MRKLILPSLLVLGLLPSLASSQAPVQMQITIGLPPQPPLLVIQPGIQVVENFGDEVFFTGGWYWVRRDNGWYRARAPRAAFVWVEPHRVPPGLVRLPPGHYRHFRREQARAEERAWREHQKAERREWKEHQKAEKRARKEQRGHGRGHGERDRD